MASLWPKDLFLNEEHSDVKVRIVAELSSKLLVYPAHSLVLKRASPVFSTMLKEDNFKEGKTGVVELKIPGHEMHAVAFLRYIYTEDLELLDLDSYITLLQAGHLYGVQSLVDDCLIQIEPRITVSSSCRIIDFVDRIGDGPLYAICLKVILRSAFLVFHKKFHLSLSKDVMCDLLSSEKLLVVDEDQVVEALWCWGKARVLEKGESVEESMMNEISPLTDHVRWSEVDNRDKNVPWFEFAVAKAKEQIGKSMKRKSDVKISLAPFANSCNISHNPDSIGTEEYPAKGHFSVLVFSVSRAVLLVGLKLRVCTTKWLIQDPVHFHVFLNEESTKDQVFHRVKFLSYGENETRWFCVTLEFFDPVLIECSRINTISIEDSEEPPALSQVVTYDLKQNTIVGTVNFNFYGDVKAVDKFYYTCAI